LCPATIKAPAAAWLVTKILSWLLDLRAKIRLLRLSADRALTGAFCERKLHSVNGEAKCTTAAFTLI
jgi:hypothetical protein